jgi:hypothetical protein
LRYFPVTGPFKRHGNCFPEVPASTWHYSGSWRWFRNKDFFSRPWREIDQTWVGIEAHPSRVFSEGEAGCLCGEFQEKGLSLYRADTWDRWARQAVEDFQQRHQGDRYKPLLVTCILISHRKPKYIHEAIASVQGQTCPDWQLVINDSGSLIVELKQYEADPRIKIVQSPYGDRCQGWQINEMVRQGLVLGDLVCYFSDDDVYDPECFAGFLAAARMNPDQQAWYGPAERMEVHEDNREVKVGDLLAGRVGGLESLNCYADGMQVFHRAVVKVPWPENREEAWHADGLFLDALGKKVTIWPVQVMVGRQRHTPASKFTRTERGKVVSVR